MVNEGNILPVVFFKWLAYMVLKIFTRSQYRNEFPLSQIQIIDQLVNYEIKLRPTCMKKIPFVIL